MRRFATTLRSCVFLYVIHSCCATVLHAQLSARDSAAVLYDLAAAHYDEFKGDLDLSSRVDVAEVLPALAYWNRAAELAEIAGDLPRAYRSLGGAGVLWGKLNVPDSAASYFLRALALAITAHDARAQLLLVDAYNDLDFGETISRYQSPDTVIMLARTAVAAESALSSGWLVAERLRRLAQAYRHVDPDSVLPILERATRMFDPSTGGGLEVLEEYGLALLDAERPDSAAAVLARGLAVAERTEASNAIGAFAFNLLRAHHHAAAHDSAVAVYDALISNRWPNVCTGCSITPLEYETAIVSHFKLGDAAGALQAMVDTNNESRELMRNAWLNQLPAEYTRIQPLVDAMIADADASQDVRAGRLLELADAWLEFRRWRIAGHFLQHAASIYDSLAAVPTPAALTAAATAHWRLGRSHAYANYFGMYSRAEPDYAAAERHYSRARSLFRAAGASLPIGLLRDRTRVLEGDSADYYANLLAEAAAGTPLADTLRVEALERDLFITLMKSQRDPANMISHLVQAGELALQLGDTARLRQVRLRLRSAFSDLSADLSAKDLTPERIRTAISNLRQLSSLNREVEPDLFPMMEVGALGNIAVLYTRLHRPDSAAVYVQRALTAAQSYPTEMHGITMPMALLQQAVVHISQQQPDSAIAVLTHAQEAYGAQGLPAIGQLLSMLQSGTYLALGRPDAALANARASLQSFEALGDSDIQEFAMAAANLMTLADTYARVGRAELGMQILRWLETEYDKRGLGAAARGPLFISIGRGYHALGKLDSAATSLSHAVQAGALSPRAVENTFYAEALYEQARVELARGQLAAALVTAETASTEARATGNWNMLPLALHLRAVLQRISRGHDGLKRALASHDTAFDVMTRVAQRTGSDENRLGFEEQHTRLFADWALAWLARGSEPDVGLERSALAALAAVERGRAQALLSLMRKDSTPAQHTSLIEEGRDLAQLAGRASAATLSYLVTPDTLAVWLLRPGQSPVVHRRAIADTTIARMVLDLRVALGADTARTRTPEGMIAAAEGPGIIARKGTGGFAEAAATLASALLPAELVRQLPDSGEILIVPHGVVGMVPFTLLPVGNERTPAATRYAIRYTPALSLLRTAMEPQRITRDARALVVGNPAMPPVPTDTVWLRMVPLAGAEAEADSVARQLGTTAVVGSAASETAIRARIVDAPIVHIATHGFAYGSEARARDSFIALAPDAQNDGLLRVAEIMDDPALRLKAELVVLSACQTGLGHLRQAEGTVGLQRAFLAKGARSVLVSLWSVSDQATELLMRRFYAHMLEDTDQPSKPEALRRAQLDVRAEPEFRNPRYWAAFQLVGAR